MSPARHAVPGYALVRIDELSFDASPDVAAMYKLSPFVWREGASLGLLLRVVNRHPDASQKRARIHHGVSHDGLHFVLGDVPVIAPGPLEDPDSYDSGGCEDPTLARDGDTSYVYYSGWNERGKRGELLLATGPDVQHLTKRGIALASSERAVNPKEAETARGDCFSSSRTQANRKSESPARPTSAARGPSSSRSSSGEPRTSTLGTSARALYSMAIRAGR
jgi:predicted GH43/DUF377 family glycosyl hydrolase